VRATRMQRGLVVATGVAVVVAVVVVGVGWQDRPLAAGSCLGSRC
jgi:hypothetical protein